MANTITVDDIEEGMILAEPVLNNFGQTLLQAGVTLSDKHKTILKTWNISLITVKTDDKEEEIEISPEVYALAEEKLKRRVKWTPKSSAEKDLYLMGIQHTAKKILKKNKGI